jgi:DNA repair protein SbcC/Rad50
MFKFKGNKTIIKMKLILKNFRCWQDQEFILPDKGLVLLSGISGSGKTSLITAIYFALYGDLRNPYTHGANTCRVELHLPKLKIVRQKRPNRLVVNDMYEDEDAQGFLENKFGLNKHEFMASSFIQQKSDASILALAPSEQMIFIERIAFDERILEESRKKINFQVRERNDALIKANSELEFAREELIKMKIGNKVKKPVSNVKEWKKRHKLIVKKSKELINERQELTEKKANIKLLATATERYEEELKIHNKKQQELSDKIRKIDKVWLDKSEDEADEELKKLKDWMEYKTSRESYENEVKAYDKMLDEELDEMQKELHSIEEKLWKDGSQNEINLEIEKLNESLIKLQDKNRTQGDLNIALEDITKLELWDEDIILKNISISKVREKLDNIIKEKDDELKEKRDDRENDREKITKLEMMASKRECPNCHSILRIEDNKLIMCCDEESDTDDEDIEELQLELKKNKKGDTKFEHELNKLKNIYDRIDRISKLIKKIDISGIDDIDEDDIITDDIVNTYENKLKELKKYINENDARQRRVARLKDKIDNKAVSKSLITMKKRLHETKKVLIQMKDDLEDMGEIDITIIKKLESYIRENREKDQHLELLKKQKAEKNQSLISAKAHLDKIQKSVGEDDVIKITKKISKKMRKIESDIGKLEEALQKDEKLEGQVQKYEEYRKTVKDKQKWKDKIDTLESGEEKRKDYLAASMTLKERSQHAEAIAVQQTIDSINEHSKTHLETMFPDNPIEVVLQTYRRTKTKKEIKPKINVAVSYKGSGSSLDSLSGGELDRCHLAFELAMNEMFGSSILMLDECISSLDSERSSEILESLKIIADKKLIIVIAHQVTTGLFDKVIEI